MNYKLKGNTTPDGSIIGNLIHDELGKLILERYNQLFQGTIAEHNHQYQENQPISFSNVPFVLCINELLRQELPNTRVLTTTDVIKNWNYISCPAQSCPDTSSIMIYPKPGLNGECHRKRILNILGETHIHAPVIVNGLNVKPFNNCSFEFIGTNHISFQELPHLNEDSRTIYKQGQIHLSREGVSLEGAVSQSGLRRVYRDWQHGLCANDDDIIRSSASGLIQLLQIQ